jgi:N-acetylmuramoyl-L-alanine amidase
MTENKIVVCGDPGHGGSLNGGGSALDIREDDYCLDIGMRIRDKLPLLVPEAEFFLTRTSDVSLSQEDRGKISREKKSDLVISMHINNIRPGGTPQNGAIAFYYPGNEIGKKVAQSIVNNMPIKLQRKRFEVFATVGKRGSDFWSRGAWIITRVHECTTVLVEFGFVQDDYNHLYKWSNRPIISNAVIAGIMAFKELRDGK